MNAKRWEHLWPVNAIQICLLSDSWLSFRCLASTGPLMKGSLHYNRMPAK